MMKPCDNLQFLLLTEQISAFYHFYHQETELMPFQNSQTYRTGNKQLIVQLQ